jgi:hypothetical protein
MTFSRILFSKASLKTRLCLLVGCLALAALVLVFSKQADTYACTIKVIWSAEEDPHTLSDSELGHLVGKWASGAEVAERCFRRFRQ